MDACVEEFAQDFLRFIKQNSEVLDAPKVSIDFYTMEDSFRKLNTKYVGRGALYFGQAISRLLDEGKIRLVSGRDYGYYSII